MNQSAPKCQSDVQSLLSEQMTKNPMINQRVKDVIAISSPKEVISEYPQSPESKAVVEASRKTIQNIIHHQNDKLLVVIGPCSIHDIKAAYEYAQWLKPLRQKYAGELEIIMRTYLEKPRTTVGWKGILHDPHLDGTGHLDEGVKIARKLLSSITNIGVPVATELLDTRSPQYFSDLISWGAIGARTVESQLHRELVSGVSFPVGMKNGTGGSIQIAIDAMHSAGSKHSFIGIDMDGHTAIIKTAGNIDTHLILRGSSSGPNYSKEDVKAATDLLGTSGRNTSVMIDFSHANSNKDYTRQKIVCEDVSEQIANGNYKIIGAMIESNLVEGKQPIGDGSDLVYGQSITDGCAGLDDSEYMLDSLAEAVKKRRSK